jgi:hypothetical protein
MFKKLKEVNVKMVKQMKGEEVFVENKQGVKYSIKYLPASFFVKNIQTQSTVFVSTFPDVKDIITKGV